MDAKLTKPVLAFDTALNGCVVAVLRPDGKSATRTLQTDREQAARLIPLIQEAMAEAETSFADLGLLVTSNGPGSFTGLRISLSTARSFSLSLGIPLHGVGTLAAMAACCGNGQNLAVLLETKRQDFYIQMFDAALKPSTAPACSSLTDILESGILGDAMLCGDAVGRFVDEAHLAGHVVTNAVQPRILLDPLILAQYGAEDFRVNGNPAIKPQPLYLREADVSVSNKVQRKIQEIPL